MMNEFIQRWHQHHQSLPTIEHDSKWTSPCEQGQANTEGLIQWQPVSMQPGANLEAVERGIELTLHPDIHEYYASYFSSDIATLHQGNPLWLLQAWNAQDFELLQQNLLGHLFTRKRLKRSPTLFIAVTDEEDLNIIVKNEDGSVWLEYVGKEPHRQLATSIQEFLHELTFA